MTKDTCPTYFLRLIDNFWNGLVPQGLGVKGLCSNQTMPPGLKSSDWDLPWSFPNCHMKDVKGEPSISRFLGLAWTRLEHGRLGRGSRGWSEGKI